MPMFGPVGALDGPPRVSGSRCKVLPDLDYWPKPGFGLTYGEREPQ